MDIIFTNTSDYDGFELPKPASQVIPEWYKQTDSYKNKTKKTNGFGFTEGTIKRCMPVFDAMTAGYIVTLPADVFVSVKGGEQYFEWADHSLIEFHPVEQAPLHPDKKPYSYPKFMSPWAIKTPKGCSILVVQPFHREAPFTLFPGIIDSDKYFGPVNFPFVIDDPLFEGLIPAGTPIAQIIPFKRETWKIKLGTKKDLLEQKKNIKQLQSRFFDRYKNMFRSPKEYK